MTPQQDSLSGVIICPAYWKGQRLRVNSFTTTNTSITRCNGFGCQPGPTVGSGVAGIDGGLDEEDARTALIRSARSFAPNEQSKFINSSAHIEFASAVISYFLGE
jgi:hypothetical protein